MDNAAMEQAERDPGRWLSIIHRLGQVHLGQALEDWGVGPGQAAFLAELAREDGLSQEELSTLLRMDKGNTARRVAALERAGLVSRRMDPADRRLRRVSLTAAGRRAAGALAEAMAAWEGALTRGFSPAERQALPRLLQRMAVNAERLLAGRRGHGG